MTEPPDDLDEFGLADETRDEPATPTVNPNVPDTLGNGIKWDTVRPAQTITMQMSFMQTGTWMGTLFGKTLE